ncbi:MAG: DUF2163 domain-containing protein [Proteobacteria bacterium]|nr:DUF2163 domain-containing protein [Pseudomonadota bacterium]
MKTLPPGLQASLASGATTLCWCWRIRPRVGDALGFTDHDRDLVFDGTLFEAASGFTATEIQSSVGLAVDNLEVQSALSSDRLSEARLAAGDFDDAAIEIFRVDWTNPDSRALARKGSVGEVRRTGSAFTAEVRGLAHYLQQTQGRIFQYSCDADLGDRRCGIDLTSPAHRATASVSRVISERAFATTSLADFSSGWFTRGLVTFSSGANAGRAGEIKRQALGAGEATIELWVPPGDPIADGDAFVVTVGCDKQFATCRAKFANTANYRGFPHIPGNDFLTTPSTG